jgi:hypothetical protein
VRLGSGLRQEKRILREIGSNNFNTLPPHLTSAPQTVPGNETNPKKMEDKNGFETMS